jgi:hypothetical protein
VGIATLGLEDDKLGRFAHEEDHMQRIRKSGPRGVVRPFQPTIDMNNSISVEEKTLEVLEHIAVSLSAKLTQSR